MATIADIKESALSDFMAEIYMEELRFLMNDGVRREFFVINQGSGKRARSRDIIDITSSVFEENDAINERLFVHLARRSLGHQLPELFFYPMSLSNGKMTDREIVAAVKANSKKEKDAVWFFTPFDMELFQIKQRLTRRFVYNHTDKEALDATFHFSRQIIQKDISLSDSQSYMLLLHLIRSEDIKEDLSRISEVFQRVLGLNISLKYKAKFMEASCFHGLGQGMLGHTFGLNGLVLSEFDDVQATITMTASVTQARLQLMVAQVKEIAGFFLFPTREVHVQYRFEGISGITLNQSFLGFDTLLKQQTNKTDGFIN